MEEASEFTTSYGSDSGATVWRLILHKALLALDMSTWMSTLRFATCARTIR